MGGRYDNVAERFNLVAMKANIAVRMTRGECEERYARWTYSLSGTVTGHGSGVDVGQPALETMLFNHNCSKADAAIIRQAAAVFVLLFGRGIAGQQPLDRLESFVATEDDRQQALTIGGLEFTNGAAACTLLVARPPPAN